MCSDTLGSPTGSQKRSYVHVPGCQVTVRGTAVSRTCVPGGYWGRVYRVGVGRAIPGTQPPRSQLLEEGPGTAERAPGSPAGAGVGWYLEPDVLGPLVRPSSPRPPLPAVGPGPLQGPVWGFPPRAKGRELRSISRKLVKTTKCHQNVSKRPGLVPIFQNGS